MAGEDTSVAEAPDAVASTSAVDVAAVAASAAANVVVADPAAEAAATKAAADAKAAAEATEAKAAVDAAEVTRRAALTDDARAAEDAAKAKADADAAAWKQPAPEKYADFSLPEGVTLSPDVASEFQKVAKELDLSQAKAQKIVDRIAPALVKNTVDGIQARATQAGDTWLAQIKADAVLGGAALDATLAQAKRGVEAFATKEFKAFLDASKLGNHPEMIRVFHKIGATVKSDSTHVSAQGNSGGVASAEDRLWPDAKK
jgi:putative NIF3 family GTP cyclohydrolase 1 type 2